MNQSKLGHWQNLFVTAHRWLLKHFLSFTAIIMHYNHFIIRKESVPLCYPICIPRVFSSTSNNKKQLKPFESFWLLTASCTEPVGSCGSTTETTGPTFNTWLTVFCFFFSKPCSSEGVGPHNFLPNLNPFSLPDTSLAHQKDTKMLLTADFVLTKKHDFIYISNVAFFVQVNWLIPKKMFCFVFSLQICKLLLQNWQICITQYPVRAGSGNGAFKCNKGSFQEEEAILQCSFIVTAKLYRLHRGVWCGI